MKTHWLNAIALVAPALRVFRAVSVLRLTRVGRVAGARSVAALGADIATLRDEIRILAQRLPQP